MELKKIIGDYERFVAGVLEQTKTKIPDVESFEIDHLCYRVESQEQYENMKNKLKSVSTKFAENEHNGRPISKFVLKTPIVIGKHHIFLIELPAPKPDKFYTMGLEHLEIVVDNNFEVFVEKYKILWSRIEDPGQFNQSAVIEFTNGSSVKFHQHTLLDVIALEGNSLTKI